LEGEHDGRQQDRRARVSTLQLETADRLKRGTRLKLLASISSGGVQRARAFVVRAP